MNDIKGSELAVVNPGEMIRQSTDAAGICKAIVTKTALEIQGRKYVRVEGWQSIATAHGYAAGSRDVERVEGGFKAIGELRRIRDGALLATAEGFVGEDEATWFGGLQQTRNGPKTLPKRPDYAIRAMAQTRAISRVCRSAFAHVVVMMDAGLSTTPAEEMEFDNNNHSEPARQESAFRQAKQVMSQPAQTNGDWRDAICTFGKRDGPLRGKPLGELKTQNLKFLYDMFVREGVEIQDKDQAMVDGLKLWHETGTKAAQKMKQDVEETINQAVGPEEDPEDHIPDLPF